MKLIIILNLVLFSTFAGADSILDKLCDNNPECACKKAGPLDPTCHDSKVLVVYNCKQEKEEVRVLVNLNSHDIGLVMDSSLYSGETQKTNVFKDVFLKS